jgi:pimeloyl-ACP methyl ester carboxylesterase
MKKILYLLVFIFVLFLVSFIFLRKADIPVEKLKTQYAPAPSVFMDINGMKAHYRKEGSGPAVLLLHGTASSLHTWEPWVEILKDSFTCISVDLPAFGLTGPSANDDYSLDMYNSFITTLMNNLSIDSFHIAGNSLGGYFAWNYALDNPERVNKLVLIASAGFPGKPSSLSKLINNPILAPLLTKISVRSLVEKNLKEVQYDDSRITDELIDRYYHMSLREGNRRALVARAKGTRRNRTDQLSNLEEPTLLMWGEEDPWIPMASAHKFDDAIPNSRIISYEKVGHIPMEEKPVISAKDAIAFLQK